MNTRLDTHTFWVNRPDVAQHYKLPIASGEELGFVMYLPNRPDDAVAIAWRHSKQVTVMFAPLRIGTLEDVSDWYPFGGIISLLSKFPPFTPEWQILLDKAPIASRKTDRAHAHLEVACCITLTDDAIVAGWETHERDTLVWLEDDRGQVYSLDKAFRRYRQDVIDHVGGALSSPQYDSRAGFVLHLPSASKANHFQIKMLADDGVHLLSEIGVTRLPVDAVKVAQWLSGVHTFVSELHGRIPLVDEPVLSELIKYRVESWEHLPVQVKQLGTPADDVRISVIIPLYGHIDFVEHQLIEFCNDPWFVEHAELIYVLDDPGIVENFNVQAELLHRLYRLPFRWVWGGMNRGFSGANNLGARQARGEYLLFLNSDVFPQQAGWLEALVGVLQQNPNIGAVGPRLVFADGGIQHAGMEFMRLEEFGVWVNRHPYMGVDPSLDPHRDMAIVPAVTGACMVMRHSEFQRVGGWNTGYLIGDFEDSDLCLKLRNAGLQIAYLPSVQLVHLERQSFKLLGQGEFRQYVTIYNAVRHQTRWGALLAQSSSADR